MRKLLVVGLIRITITARIGRLQMPSKIWWSNFATRAFSWPSGRNGGLKRLANDFIFFLMSPGWFIVLLFFTLKLDHNFGSAKHAFKFLRGDIQDVFHIQSSANARSGF